MYACAVVEETSSNEQAVDQLNGSNMNGSNMNGSNMNGSNMNGWSLRGIQFAGATHGGVALTDLHVYRGELVATKAGATVRGTQLDTTLLKGMLRNSSGTVLVDFRINGVQAESGYDPTGTGSTFLYTLEVNDPTAGWTNACPADVDGKKVTIPLEAEWDETGTRYDDSGLFTLACTSGVIAKCYRWGYKPWLTGYSVDMATMHWTCTRLARADFCGNGISHTTDGTWINVWDMLTPGPIQQHAVVSGMSFDSGWSTSGATCLSNARYSVSGATLATQCPGKFSSTGATNCNSSEEALLKQGSSLMFKESYLN